MTISKQAREALLALAESWHKRSEDTPCYAWEVCEDIEALLATFTEEHPEGVRIADCTLKVFDGRAEFDLTTKEESVLLCHDGDVGTVIFIPEAPQ